MKIIFSQDALVNAGTERSNFELISRFSTALEVAVVYFYPHHELKEVYERAGIRLFFLNIPERYHLLKGTWRLIQLIRKEKPDLVVSSLWRADILTRFACWVTNTPLIGTLVNDSYAPLAWKDKHGWKHQVVYWLDRLTSGVPFHWISNAQALVDSHVKTLGIDRNKVSVVYRGRPVIEHNFIARTRNEDEAISKGENFNQKETASPDSFGIAVTGNSDDVIGSDKGAKQSQKRGANRFVSRDDEPIRNFISYGRLLERKGFQDAILAFAEVFRKYPDCILTIFGEGPYRQELESLIQKLDLQNSVFLPGKIPNPVDVLIGGFYFPLQGFDLHNSRCSGAQPDKLQLSLASRLLPPNDHQLVPDNCQLITADCFLFPSWYEGFSGALVEAMLAGIPIIASDIPMNLEAVEDQKTALIFPVQDADALVKQMTRAIENPEEMQILGVNARKVAEERFDIEKIAKQYEAILKKLSKSKGK